MFYLVTNVNAPDYGFVFHVGRDKYEEVTVTYKYCCATYETPEGVESIISTATPISCYFEKDIHPEQHELDYMEMIHGVDAVNEYKLLLQSGHFDCSLPA